MIAQPFVETWAVADEDIDERDIKASEFPAVETRTANLFTAGEVIEGIDLNRFRRYDLLDPLAVYNSGKRFAILEATWGLWQPPSFAEFWPRLLDAGFILLGYGFFCGDQSGVDQAELLLETVRPMHEAQGFKMPLFSDVEPFKADTSKPAQRVRNWHDWVFTIRNETTPGAYSNVPYWRSMMLDEPLPQDAIGWAAHYTPSSNWASPFPMLQTDFQQYGIAKIHNWVKPVPGMKGVVDCNKFFGTETNLLALGVGIEVPMTDPELLARVAKLETDVITLTGRVTALEGGATPPPPVTPPPAPDDTIVITADPRANARFASSTNNKGKPIMEIYPKDTAPTADRIQFTKGTELAIVLPMVTADGGMKYYQLRDRKGRAGETLYVREVDAILA